MESNSDMPLVSIGIPSFNHERYIGDCLRSIINQSYANIELIVIDDGSMDNSADSIQELAQTCKNRFSRFEFRQRANRGLTATLNEAIHWAKGKYFCSLASDDLVFPEKIARQVTIMESDCRIAGVFSYGNAIDENGIVIDEISTNQDGFTFEQIFLNKHRILAPTQMLRMDCLRDVGCYPDNLSIEDWYLWLAMTRQGYKLVIIDEVLAGYRIHDSNYHKDPTAMLNGRLDVLEKFDDHPLYDKAVATVYLMASFDFSLRSKRTAAHYFRKALALNKAILFQPWGILGLVSIGTPKVLLQKLRSSLSVFRLIN